MRGCHSGLRRARRFGAGTGSSIAASSARAASEPGANHPVGTPSGRASNAPPPRIPSARAVIASTLLTDTGTRHRPAEAAASQGVDSGPVNRVSPGPSSSIVRVLTTVARSSVESSGRRSTSRESIPWRASAIAAVSPAGPAPTISTGASTRLWSATIRGRLGHQIAELVLQPVPALRRAIGRQRRDDLCANGLLALGADEAGDSRRRHEQSPERLLVRVLVREAEVEGFSRAQAGGPGDLLQDSRPP